MRIAIMTWWHYKNYGTALQVCALSHYLKNLGHSVDVINYIPKGNPIVREAFSLNSIFRRVANKIDSHLYPAVSDDQKNNIYEQFLKENICLTNPCETLTDLYSLNNEYDCFICGSDQIWAPTCFDRRYFLDFVTDEGKMIAYAPSVGLDFIFDKDIESEMRRLITRFELLSTREQAGSNLISSLVSKKVETVLDPTLLLSRSEWLALSNCIINDSKDYLLVYFLGHDESYWKSIYRVASSLNLDVKIIPVYKKDYHRQGCIKEPLGPKEFIKLIGNSSFVCTDSFHGLAFSIVFQKEFLIYKRFKDNSFNNQNSRILNLVSLLNLSDRVFHSGFEKKIDNHIDYGLVEKALQDLIDSSKQYLYNALIHVESHEKSIDSSINDALGLCCGCGACFETCPVKAISIINENGFAKAQVDENKCISCKKCLTVCPFVSKKKAISMYDSTLYSYKDNNTSVLLKSSSGGAAYRLTSQLISKDYDIIGCSFEKNTARAVHNYYHNNDNPDTILAELQGSKYLQSDFYDVIGKIQNSSSSILVLGTPCQIAGVKRLVGDRENIIYIDLICHGVPSQFVMEKYRSYLSSKGISKEKDINIVFRDKEKGWRERHIKVDDGEHIYQSHQNDDPFYRIFESCYCFAPCCYECNWRDSTEADIRLGDYWGNKFTADSEGVSMIIAATPKGEQLVSELKEFGKLQKEAADDYYVSQQTKNTYLPAFYDRCIQDLNNEQISIDELCNEYVRPFELRKKIQQLYSRFVSIVR